MRQDAASALKEYEVVTIGRTKQLEALAGNIPEDEQVLFIMPTNMTMTGTEKKAGTRRTMVGAFAVTAQRVYFYDSIADRAYSNCLTDVRAVSTHGNGFTATYIKIDLPDASIDVLVKPKKALTEKLVRALEGAAAARKAVSPGGAIPRPGVQQAAGASLPPKKASAMRQDIESALKEYGVVTAGRTEALESLAEKIPAAEQVIYIAPTKVVFQNAEKETGMTGAFAFTAQRLYVFNSDANKAYSDCLSKAQKVSVVISKKSANRYLKIELPELTLGVLLEQGKELAHKLLKALEKAMVARVAEVERPVLVGKLTFPKSQAVCPRCGAVLQIEHDQAEAACGCGASFSSEEAIAGYKALQESKEDFVIQAGVLIKYNGSAANVIIPQGVREIGESAFGKTMTLEQVILPDGVKAIGPSAFSRCENLKRVSLPEGLERIEVYAFYGCFNLEEINIPDSLRRIGPVAFYPGIAGYEFHQPFKLKVKMSERQWVRFLYDFEETEEGKRRITQYDIRGGVLVKHNRSHAADRNAVIPEGVREIADDVFIEGMEPGDYWMESLTLPEGLQAIGKHAFGHCEGLKELTIPKSVTKIGVFAFGRTGITEVTVPGGVAVIEVSAFSGCKELRSVVIEEGVQKIEGNAFGSCEALTHISIPPSVTEIDPTAFLLKKDEWVHESGKLKNKTWTIVNPALTNVEMSKAQWAKFGGIFPHADKPEERPLADVLKSLIKNSIKIDEIYRYEGEPPVGTSKIGGKPDLPPGFAWFYYFGDGLDIVDGYYSNERVTKNRPLAFLAQINCEEASAFDKDALLPTEGMLYFFYELAAETWGHNPEDKGSARVYYHPGSIAELQRTDFPADLLDACKIDETPIKFSSLDEVPDYFEFSDWPASQEALWPDEEGDEFEIYDEVKEEVVGDEYNPKKLLGYADVIQHSMLDDCEAMVNGIHFDYSTWRKLPEDEKQRHQENRTKWQLLLQLDEISAGDFDFTWGDMGKIYFYINRDDLARRSFDRCWLHLQCS